MSLSDYILNLENIKVSGRRQFLRRKGSNCLVNIGQITETISHTHLGEDKPISLKVLMRYRQKLGFFF